MGQESWGTGVRRSASPQERIEWQLNQIREALASGGPDGGGATPAEIQAAIEAANTLDDVEQYLIEVFSRIGLLSAQFEEDSLSLAPGGVSGSQLFNGFANCNCSFALSGLLANETAVLAIEHKATANAPFIQMQLATVTGFGNHTITFSNFPALELRLRLVSAVNSATRLTGVYWRFGK
jgi:hypothetical protein